jgi:hypothetical protein
MGWPLVTTLGRAFPHGEVYCQTCDKWIAITRDATAAESAGLPPIPIPYDLTDPGF